ncbi:hypothetical protein C8A01DRAFT_18942 [Parachaetomium inaequale]|uniref:ATP synthase F0 n=1 Tax=Parachaetomium inaequale TaxID=2588326 RepID=A0AAN6P9H9_9PEZI|nr:hypothetical protein C8A01DRAFT_18942 [Parachaetomium inaequale]
MDRFHQINPFAKRDSHSAGSVVWYKVLTLATWLLSVVVTVYYAVEPPHEGKHHGKHYRGSIWHQNYDHYSGFTLNAVITSIYWIVLFILQLGYISHLFSSKTESVNAACAVGSHFIANNLLHTAFILLFVHSHFVWAEVLLLLNFANLTSLYFRHNTYPRFIHLPAVSGPLAWTFVAIYWNGAIMVPHSGTLVARVFANVFVWSVLGYGLFFIILYKDYTMGFALSVLSASLGVAQFFRQIVAFQWIFAFTIMAVLFVMTVVVAVPAWTGRQVPWGAGAERRPADAERAPLLAE